MASNRHKTRGKTLLSRSVSPTLSCPLVYPAQTIWDGHKWIFYRSNPLYNPESIFRNRITTGLYYWLNSQVKGLIVMTRSHTMACYTQMKNAIGLG